MKSMPLIAVLGVVTLAFASPGHAERQRSADVSRLEIRIRQTLVERLGDDAKTIQVAVNGKKAYLTGTVNERVTQEFAKEIALSFDEIDSATNRIEARKAPRLDQGQAFVEGTDAELEFKLRRALGDVLGPLVKALQIEVVDGIASLRGTLPDLDRKMLALSTTKNFTGIRDTLDLIRTVR